MKTKKPTAKLPRAEALYLGSRLDLHGAPIHDYCHPVAVIPTHTPAQARQLCKAAPILQLSEGEKVERLAKVLCYMSAIAAEESEGFAKHCMKHSWRTAEPEARAVLAAMGLGGGK